MKWLDLVMTILGVISAIGSLVAMYVLSAVTEAVNAVAQIDTSLLGVEGFSSVISTVQLMISIGWVWTVAVLLTSIYATWTGIGRLRAGK